MTYDEAKEAYGAAEYNFDAACARLKSFLIDLERARRSKNKEAIAKAQAGHARVTHDHEAAADAMRQAQDRLERAATVERRKALLAPRNALRQAQGVLF
jgi:hypothetical protein